MPTLVADLELQLDTALSNLEQLDTAFASSAQAFGDQLGSAITDALQVAQEGFGSLGGSGTGIDIPVTVDAAQAESELSTLDQASGSAAAGLDAVTTASDEATTALADTASSSSEVSSALSDASSSADSSSGSIDALGGVTSGLHAAQGLATGSAAGLGAAVGEMGSGAGAVVGAVGAAAAGIGVLAEEGLKAVSAEQRFNQILGDQAEAVKNVQVGNLSSDIYKLGIEFGSTNAAMQESVATIYQHAAAAGFAAEKSRTYADELVAMGARAVALKPSLGNIGDVVEGLETKFARSRGLVQYGISISQAEINTRAMTIAGVNSAAQLTVQDKAFAGLQIATEKYGGSLNEVVAKGAANAANQQKSLDAELKNTIEEMAKPLAAPFLDLLRQALPDFEAAGQLLAAIASSVLPAVASALGAVTPVLQGFAAAVSFLAPIIPPVVTGLIAFEAVSFLPALLTLIGTGFTFVGETLGVLPAQAAAAAAGMDTLAESSVGLAGPVGLLVGGFLVAKTAGEGLANLLGEAPSDEFPKAIEKLTFGLENTSDWSDAATVKLLFLGTSTMKSLEDGTNLATAKMSEFRTVLQKSPADAQELIYNLAAAGVETRRYQLELNNSIASQTKQITTQTAATQAIQQSTFQLQAATAIQKIKGTQDAAAITDALALAEATRQDASALQGTAAAYENANQASKDYKLSLDILSGGHESELQATQQFAAQLIEVKKDLDASRGSLDLNTESGNKSAAALISLNDNAKAVAAAMVQVDGNSTRANGALAAMVQTIIDTMTAAGDSIPDIAAFIQKLGDTSYLTPAQAALLGIQQSAGDAGTGSTAAFGAGLEGLPATAQTAADAVGTKLSTTLPPQMSTVGASAGLSLDQGLATGITNNEEFALAAAHTLGTDAAAAIRDALGIKSPSQVFMDIGGQMASGLALGIQGGQPQVVAAMSDLSAAAQRPLVVAGPSGATPGPSGSPGYTGAAGATPGAPAGGGGTQIGPFYVTGVTDPQQAAAAAGREMSIQQRYSGVSGVGN